MNPPGDESAGDESAGDESAGDESAGHRKALCHQTQLTICLSMPKLYRNCQPTQLHSLSYLMGFGQYFRQYSSNHFFMLIFALRNCSLGMVGRKKFWCWSGI